MVKAGETIARVGRDGNVDRGSHTHNHFEVMINGTFVNPGIFFSIQMQK